MRPAFSTLGQKLAFALVAFLALTSPLLVGKRWSASHEQMYATAPWQVGAFPYLHDQIFEEQGDIDIAFMGDSIMWLGIDAPQVQAELTRATGRPATVRALDWTVSGLDAFYFIFKDLVEHRRVHMVVFSPVTGSGDDKAHWQTGRWFQYASDRGELAGLGWRRQVSFYNNTMVSMPLALLGLFRSNLPAIPTDEIHFSTSDRPVPNPAGRLGALAQRTSLFFDFTNYAPVTAATPADVRVYSPATPSPFTFGTQGPVPLQLYFARKVAALAREHHVILVSLHMPLLDQAALPVIPENAYWPDVFQTDLPMVGIPGARLFAGLSPEEIRKLYWEKSHLNENGQKYFTRLITPALVKLYEDQVKP